MSGFRRRLLNKITSYSHEDFFYYVLSSRLAPVFESLRPSCLLCLNDRGRPMYSLWKKHQSDIKTLLPFSVYTISDDGENARILIYDKIMLEKSMNLPGVKNYMTRFGYEEAWSLQERFAFLSQRFQESCPHEIGLFLGYPLHDVINFIHEYRPCIMTGYWKVYCHEEEARAAFRSFDRARFLVDMKFLSQMKPAEIFYKLCQN